MSEKLKKLTSKNPKDYESVAKELINSGDVELFSELVNSEDFLFDFVKQNVAKRLEKYINESNYMNLVKFLKYYSPSYEDLIISSLVEYANEDLTELMLNLFKNGTVEEKTYCAKYFSYVKDTLAIDFLNSYAFCNDSELSSNCAQTLSYMGEVEAYNKALEMLNSEDDFIKLDGVKFLISYGNKNAIKPIICAMRTSNLAENIASEIPYLCDLFEIYKNNQTDALIIANHITNSLGEITSLSQVFDFKLYEFYEMIMEESINSEVAAVLLNANEKFNTLTENNEYLFDETKDTKQEINDIKSLLQTLNIGVLYKYTDSELKSDSPFVFTALEYTEDEEKVRELLKCENPSIIIRSLEILKQMEVLTKEDKEIALKNIYDLDLQNIVMSI